MAGSRVYRQSSIFKRAEGLLKSEALEWKNRPLWYDVMEKFPPQVEPRMDRPVPNVHVKKILYPEDFVRAKLLDVYESTDVINLRLKRRDIKTKPQMFVEEYLKLQRLGVSVEQIFQEIETKFQNEGKRLLRKKNPVVIKSVNIEEEAKDDFDIEKQGDIS